MDNNYIYIAITILFTAFFSGMEVAFISSSKMRIELSKGSKGPIKNILAIFYRHTNEFISSLLVGNIITLVIYALLISKVLDNYLLFNYITIPFVRLVIEIILASTIILFLGEFIPKIIIKRCSYRFLQIFAVPMLILYAVLYPLSRLFAQLAKGLLWMRGKESNNQSMNKAFTKIDLDNFIQSGVNNADKDEKVEDEVRIFQNALDFSTIKIRDCIVPRTEIKAIEIEDSLDELKLQFIQSGHSKLIVYKENIDNITGYIHSSEMFRHPDNWKAYIQQVPIVPETMTARKLMEMFMQQKKTLAVVVDEFGGTTGIVSLEDLVEELLGDIEDEHDTTTYIAKQLNSSEYILSARLEIEKVNEMFELELPESEEYLTIGGLILYTYQSFPKLHETVTIGKYQFKIIKRTTTKIELVRLKVTD